MPRNTFLVVSLLAILAALIIGVNLGKRLSGQSPTPVSTISPSPHLTPTPTPIPTTMYVNTLCGISFPYPATFTKQETPASTSAIFIDPQNTTSMIIFTCQKAIPRPALSTENIETITVGSASAKLYHDTNAKDGTPIDKLIFRHPKNGLDIFLAGMGPVFQQAIASLNLLP